MGCGRRAGSGGSFDAGGPRVKGMLRSLANAAESGAADRLARTLSGRGAILAYHAVLQRRPESQALHITLAELEAQLATLSARGYRFLSLIEMLDRLESNRTVTGCVVVTFDDAYFGTLSALPLLRRLQVPATIFVPTSFIGTDARFWWDQLFAASADHPAGLSALAQEVTGRHVPAEQAVWAVRSHIMGAQAGRPAGTTEAALVRLSAAALAGDDYRAMTWAELRAWTEWEGATVAPHSITHPVLPRLPADEQHREMRRSLDALQSELPDTLPVIAYPYGLYAASTVEAAGKAGFRRGVTMNRVGAYGAVDPLTVPRLPVGGLTRVQRMGLYVSDVAAWYRRRELVDGYPPLPEAGAYAPPP